MKQKHVLVQQMILRMLRDLILQWHEFQSLNGDQPLEVRNKTFEIW